MQVPRLARWSLVFLVVGFAWVPCVRAQVEEAGSPQVLPAQQVELVRIEVVVTEKRGRSRAGMTREDFAVFEDGKPQPIVQFHAFTRPRAATPAQPSQPSRSEDEAPDDLLPARYIVLAIDDVHMELDSLAQARKALLRFLSEDLRPEDQVALVTTSGASALSQEFTGDRAVLRQILSRLSAQGRHAEWSGVPHISEYQAELINSDDPLALDAAIEEILAGGLIQDRASAEQVARRKARAILDEAVYNSRLTLEALESLCRGLSGLSGRKALVFVSDGFLTMLASRGGSAFDLRRIADAGTRAGVVIYTLDSRGLAAAPPAASASSPTRFQPATIGMIEAMRRRSEAATRHAMHALAADTGGFLFENSNNLRAGLREILRDTEAYYVLAYEPTNTSRDGRFRRIDVRVPGQRGLEIRTRSGYFASDDRRAETEGTAVEDARRQEQRQAEMRTALNALAPLTAIPVRVSADFVSLDGSESHVVVTGNVDVEKLPFARLRGRRQATVETAALVYDEAGALATTLETERTTMDLSEADYGQVLQRGLPYQRAVSLKPGRYQVRLAVREDATGLLGSAWRRVEVPELSPGRLALSSLFLLKDGSPPDAAASPNAGPVLHSVQALPRFARSENLYVQLYAYNPGRDPSGATDLVAQEEVSRGGVLLATGAPEPMASARKAGPVTHISRIKLQSFERGDYELRVTVTDRRASAMVTRAVAFTVD